MITNLTIGHNGRLGNQIFQYAILKCISFENGYEVVLPKENAEIVINGRFNPSINNIDRYKLDLLECFQIKDKVLDTKEITKNLLFQYKENLTMDYKEDFLSSSKDNTNYDGFFQCIQYFEKYQKELKNCLKFNSTIEQICNLYIEKIKKYYNIEELITIHIRRGDLAGDQGKYQVLLSPEYYKKLINKLSNDKNKFLILSDDLEWCKKEFIGNNIIFCDYSVSSIPAHFIDFGILSKGNKIIMSPSSFSWWAAFLSEAKEIYCPNRWYGSEYSNFNEQNVRHSSWIQVQYEGLP
jgi:hypothetical protein